MNIPLTNLKAQYTSIKDEVDEAIHRVLQQGQFILGPEIEAFETEMAIYCGTKFAVGVASGTDALHLALLACGVKSGDEVITTPFTFIATTEAIVNCGAIPIFVDIEPRTLNIDSTKIEAKITPKTKAIIPVHLYGLPAAMEEIIAIGKKHNIKVIEDCAQALGTNYKGQKVGTLGNAGCLSFFPAKTLGAYGDGGMVITDDSTIAERVRMLRVHGAKSSYYHVISGFNSRLDSIQATILRIKLKYLDTWIKLRQSNATLYSQLLKQIDGIEIPYTKGYALNYYTIRLKGRDELRKHLKSKGIQTMVYYPLSLHLQEVYSYLGYKLGDFPESERAQEQVLSLPMYPELQHKQIRQIVNEIGDFLA